MHPQPVFSGARTLGGHLAPSLFPRGLCLPSGSSLTDAEQDEICTEFARARIVVASRHPRGYPIQRQLSCATHRVADLDTPMLLWCRMLLLGLMWHRQHDYRHSALLT